MKKIFVSFFLFLSLFSFSQTDQNITNTVARETEPFIAVNPANPNNIIAAWMRISFPTGIATKASFDGGTTWGNLNFLPHFTSSIFVTSADVSITFNNSGTAFICYVDYKVTLDSGFVRVAISTNGGVTWNNPVNAINALSQPDLPVDRPWIVCDKSNSAYSGRIYLVSKSYYAAATPHKIWLSISSDTANTFSAITRLDNPVTIGTLTNIMGVPTIGADGTFYCAYASWNTSFDPFPRFVCTKSTNGGNTFSQYTIAYPVSGSPVTDTLYQGSYSIDANPMNAANLIFQATDARFGDPDILTVYSIDGGQTWTTVPVRVNDDAVNNGLGQEMSWGAFSPNGIYAVAWRDRRTGIPNDTSDFEIWTSVSLDGGATFKPNYLVSSVPSPYINQIRGNDFLGVSLSSTYLFADWSDNRNNNPNKEDIYVRKISLNTLASANQISFENFSFSIYPNPNLGEIFIEVNIKSTVKIYDLAGKEVFVSEITVGTSKIKTDFADGTYFLKLENEKGVFTKKIVICR